MNETIRHWGMGFDPEYNPDEIRDFLSDQVPHPERLQIIKLCELYIAGYGYLPVTNEQDQANVVVMETWPASWWTEEITYV